MRGVKNAAPPAASASERFDFSARLRSRLERNTMQAISKSLLILAALDSVAMGAVALISPSLLFHFLQIPSNNDGLLLCRLLGVLFLAHGPFLFLAARQPRIYGGLTLAAALRPNAVVRRLALAARFHAHDGRSRRAAGVVDPRRLMASDLHWLLHFVCHGCVSRGDHPNTADTAVAHPQSDLRVGVDC